MDPLGFSPVDFNMPTELLLLLARLPGCHPMASSLYQDDWTGGGSHHKASVATIAYWEGGQPNTLPKFNIAPEKLPSQ